MKIIPTMLLHPDDRNVRLTVIVKVDDRPPNAIAEGEISYEGRPAATLLAEVFDELAATLRASVEDRP